MHTYNRNGIRKSNVLDKAKTKKQVKTFYNKLKQIDTLSDYLKTLDESVTEDNIDLIVPELIGRNLDSIEKNLILNKLSYEPQGDEASNI
jgi:outer membrane PBP1 activator LpoA protein